MKYLVCIAVGALLGFAAGWSLSPVSPQGRIKSPDTMPTIEVPANSTASSPTLPEDDLPRTVIEQPPRKTNPGSSEWEEEKSHFLQTIEELRLTQASLLQENNNMRARELKRAIKAEIWEGIEKAIEEIADPFEKSKVLEELPHLASHLGSNLGGEIGGFRDWNPDKVRKALQIAGEIQKEWIRSSSPSGNLDGDPTRCLRTISRNHANDFRALLSPEQFSIWDRRFPSFAKPPYQDFYCKHSHL